MLLGFDIRIPLVETGKLWSEGRRERFLLSSDMPHPLSVDDYVWPSVFRYHFPPTEILKSISVIPVDRQYTDQSLWLNLARMRDCYAHAVPHDEEPGIEIAVELIAPDGLTVDEFPSSLIYQKRIPTAIPEGASSLGFDVADTGLTSGLNNTDYGPEEKKTLSPWSQRLNEHGLIRTLEDAERFRSVTDNRNPKDAPYWVYQLWKLN